MEQFLADKENGGLQIPGDVGSGDEESNDESEYETDDNDADVEENNEDEHPENESKELENNSVVSDKSKMNTSSRKKRKRKKKDNTKRRQIRKILDESQLDRETLNAQLEERERLRRLELQKSLAATEGLSAHPVSTTPPCNSDSCTPQSPVVVDFRKKTKQQSAVIVIDSDDEDDDANNQHNIEVISSGSDNGSDDMKSYESDTEEDSDIDENNVGLHSDDKFNVPNQNGSVLVNTDHPLSEDDIFLAPQIARCVKPHQIGGIRFLYDNLIETLARYHVSAGFGCILAHSMGLGKTLQVVAFTDIFLRYTPAKKVLIVVPINTIQNWMGEFDMWIPCKPDTINIEGSNGTVNDCSEIRYRNFDVYLLGDNNKTTVARAKIIGLWNQNGGVLLMGYELYRILAMSTPCMASNKCAPPKKKKSSANSTSNSQEPEVIDLEEEEKNMDFLIGIQKALCKPGPDLVICDEGHRIKNNQANISQALKRIKTRRRVVLTGYPLQNNLVEYWCMVDFVRPNFLGTRQEFSNMFERPILNGQCSDSTPSDVRLMRYRAHVLHSLLEGFVQRRSQAVLTKCLPTKEEHIILIKLSDIQSQLYRTYINYLLESAGHINPIKGFHTCTKIWNHPDVFYSMLEPKKYGQRYQSPLTLQDSEVDETVNNLCGAPEESETNKSITPGQQVAESVNNISASLSWAKDIMKDYKPLVSENGGKVVILMEIIKESLRSGEKVLVFSQSLSTLGIIEDFLSRREIPYFPGRPENNGNTKWARNKSYFRLDGSTPSQERDRLINAFNSPDNFDVLLFMLSTRAGCLGVNLIGASRVVVFDASWNPCHDVQAVCRVYRYGQRKQTHIYRLVSVNTMEKKIYDRQVSKQGVANRVVDELNPEANFTKQEIMTLICEKEPDIPAEDVASAAVNFTDPVLNSICRNYSDWLAKLPFKHESLLVDRKELKLTKMEKKEARKGYEREKNMAQQGSRYYINPVQESSRGSSSSSSSFAGSSRPAGNSIPTASTILPRLPQPQQAKTQNLSPYFLQNLLNQSNVRFATLNTNRTPNPLSANQLMPNISARLAANIIANQLQISRALNTAANPQFTSGSSCRLPGLPTGLTPGQMSGVIHGHMSGSTPGFTPGLTPGLSPGLGTSLNGRPTITTSTCSLSTSTHSHSANVVTIDLDDVPSPPPAQTQSESVVNASDIDVTTATNTGSPSEPDRVPYSLPTMVPNATIAIKETSEPTIEKNETPDVAMQTKETEAAMETKDTTNGRTLIEVVLPQQHFVTMETEQTNNLDSASNSDAMVTDNAPPLGTRPALPLAVLQNLLNEQGGLGTRPLPPEESPHSPTGSSQI